MEQEQIIYENTLLRAITSHYKKYEFKSLGNCIHWLYTYGLIQYDIVQFGDNKVTLHGTQIATIDFDDQLQMPIFTFIDKYDWLKNTQTHFINGLSKYPNPFIN